MTAEAIAFRTFQSHVAKCPTCRNPARLCDVGLRLYRVCRDFARAALLPALQRARYLAKHVPDSNGTGAD